MADDPQQARSKQPAWQWLGVALLLVLVAGLIYWIAPKRQALLVSVDGENQWPRDAAPMRREVVWQPAKKTDPPGKEIGAADSLIRPALTDDGTSLYFTLRRSGEDADIYHSRLVDGQWQPAELVAELNTEAEDIGPVIRSDGKQLYLYSDREGGHGGFDIYVADRTADGWTKPRNAGLSVNSPAHEYDPAITADGQRMYFASNRTPRMQRLLREGKLNDSKAQWNTTLRGELGLNKFDLYAATQAEDGWRPALAMQQLNTDVWNEGAPFVSPDDGFLYFASDRVESEAAGANFDIYRARLRENRTDPPENLGPGINTAAHEIEPALSPEGFRLYFSRNEQHEAADAATREQYSLFASQAVEVERDAYWDDTNWRAFTLFLANNWWWIVLALLLLVLLAALAWAFQTGSLRRAQIPGYLLIALLIHLFLGVGSFWVFLGDDLVRVVKNTFSDNEVIEAQLVIEETNQSTQPDVQPYEKVADVDVEMVQPTPIARQQTVAPNVPVPSDTPTMRVPSQVSPDAVDRIAETIPRAEPQEQVEPMEPIERQQQVPLAAESEAVELEQVEAAEPSQPQESPRQVDVQVARRSDAPKPEYAPEPVAQSTSESQPTRETKVARSASSPSAVPETQPNQDALARAESVPQESVPEESAEAIAVASQSSDAAPDSPQPVDVNVPRQAASASADVAPPTESTQSQAAPSLATADAAEPVRTASAPTPQPSDTSVEDGLPRAEHNVADVSEAEQVATADVPTVASDPAEGQPQLADVKISKASQSPSAAELPEQSAPSASPAAKPNADIADLAASRTSRPQPAAEATAQPTDQVARAVAPGAPSEAEQAETLEALANATEAGDAEAQPGVNADVAVAKQATGEASPLPMPVASGVSSGDAGQPTADVPSPGRAATPDVSALAMNQPSDNLMRQSTFPFDATEGEQVETVELTAATSEPGEGKVRPAGFQVGVDRAASELTELSLATPNEIGGPHDPARPDLALGGLARRAVDAPVSFGPETSLLELPTARAPQVLYGRDTVNMREMLTRRDVSEKEKREIIEKYGGDDEILNTIRRGLKWMARHQMPDGRWSITRWADQYDGKAHREWDIKGKGVESDTAATGFALLSFLGDGNTHQQGEYANEVKRGLDWLRKNQKSDGNLWTGGEGNGQMYSHGIATIALCECYGMSKDPALREPAQRAVDFIVQAQGRDGGWRYRPGDHSGDMSVFGWQIMALKSGQIADLYVPQQTLQEAKKWLESAAGRGNNHGRYGYQPGHEYTPAMTAEGLLCKAYLGAERGDDKLLAGADYLLENLPRDGKESSYYWYYGTQIMYHLQGEHWDAWNQAASKTLMETQILDGPMTGSWRPDDKWEDSGGRVMSTGLRVLMLEAYYRHLPLYEIVE